MRCFPRKGRQQCVVFLLVVCLLGVYLAYRQLLESEPLKRNYSLDDGKIENLQQQLQQRVHGNLKLPKHPLMADGRSNKEIIDQYKIDDKNALPPVFPAGRVLENEDDYVTNDEKVARLKLLLITLSPRNWKTTLDPDEMILLAKSELLDLGVESKLTCKEIDNMKSSHGRQQGFYGKKIIDFVKRNQVSDYVLKSVGRDQQLKIECMKMDYRENRCHLMGNYRLVKELVLFQILEHPSIIKVEGFCLRGETIDPRVKMKGAVIVTEAGKQIQHDLYQLLPWTTKVELVIQLMKLLLYLDSSPVGSLGFDKLQMNDFVMLNSDIKLVDLDNLRVGEQSCQRVADCAIADAPNKEIQCVDNVCKGRNLMQNLFLLHQSVLSPLLKYSQAQDVEQMQENIKALRLTPKEVIAWFEKHRSSDFPVGQPDNRNNKQQDNGQADRQDNARHGDTNKKDSRLDTVVEMETDTGAKNTYRRQANSNFPAMMTMVMKNEADGNPEPNYGATLFRKSRGKGAAIAQVNGMANEGKPVEQKVEKPIKTEKFDFKACISRAANVTKSARDRREKRLLTHLGLRGISESEWKTYAESSKIMKYLGPSQLSSSSVRGGRFKFQYESNELDLKKGEFIAEMGPKYYHISYLATYHLDRILGLYHIPPTVLRTVPISELKRMHGDKFPLNTYMNISGDTGLRGVVTVPAPPVMKTNTLTIEKKESLVTSVPDFSRSQKVQIEYILLWSLTKMMQPQHGYLGYKGHLIHFEADLAFQSLQKSLTGYFFNCQFPNAVYKTLACYKCQDAKKSSTVCGLGFEVIRRLRNNGYTGTEIRVGSLTGKDITTIIDSSASSILQIVDQCIKTFAREEVLY